MSGQAVEIWTDGACKGNPGPGGWGVLMLYKGNEIEICGGEAVTTNNRMELTAASQGLEALKRGMKVRIHTASFYPGDGITK